MKKQYEELKTGSSKLTGSVDPLRREIDRLQRENNELHTDIIKVKEELDNKDITWNTVHNRVEEQKNHLKFLLDKKEIEIKRVTGERDLFEKKVEELSSKLFLPSKGIVLGNVPSEFEN